MNDAPETILFNQFATLESTLVSDASGERARALVAYLAQVNVDIDLALQASGSLMEKSMLRQLMDALAAGQQVVQTMWQRQHAGTAES